MTLDDLINALEDRGIERPKRILHAAYMEILEEERTLDQLMQDPFYGGSFDPKTADLLRRAISLHAGLSVEIVEPNPGIRKQPRQWLDGVASDIDWFHWNRYRQTLAANGWDLSAIKTIDTTSKEILANTPEILKRKKKNEIVPTEKGFDEWRGLIVGHVQSGKTAMFTGLICRGCDVGYKLIIVLAGMLNSLRLQTQERLSSEILGKPDGVPMPAGRHWHELTKCDLSGDFSAQEDLYSRLQEGQPPVLAVVKKNVSVLQLLNEALGKIKDDAKSGTQYQSLVNNLSVLVIDDESDEASVNTGSGDRVSSTNAEIRTLLRIFPRTTYVGFTATPYANCFIPVDARDEGLGVDLYPKDYILPLNVGSQYVSSDFIFGRAPANGDSGKSRIPGVFQKIPVEDLAGLVPPAGKYKDGTPKWKSFKPRMVPSLRTAIQCYVLAGAARISRGEGDKHATMLVNVSTHPAQHGPVPDELDFDEANASRDVGQRGIIRAEVESMRATLVGGNGSEQLLEELNKVWNSQFMPTFNALDPSRSLLFEEIEPYLNEFISDIKYRVINGTSPHTLDFRRGTKSNPRPPLKAIVIGGQALGRGLTLEDLLCTYFTRESGNMATAVQMQRWCGYRGKIKNLMKVFTTEDVRELYYEALAVEEEMRTELAKYGKEDVRPDEVSMLLRQHPKIPLTTKNKSKGAMPYYGQYSGRIPQTTLFPLKNAKLLEANLEATKEFIQMLNGGGVSRRNEEATAVWWKNVEAAQVMQYLERYSYPTEGGNSRTFDCVWIIDYIKDQIERKKHLKRWIVALCGKTTDDPEEPDRVADFGDIKNVILRRRVADKNRIGIITDPEHESIGLDTDKNIRGAKCREQRSPDLGLLLIYPVRATERDGSWQRGHQVPVAGLAISFSSKLVDNPLLIAGGYLGRLGSGEGEK